METENNLEMPCAMVGLKRMRDLNVDQIKKLWILELIIRSGSLKSAALKAKVSPSAISQTLSSLEQSLGKPLLIRERGKIIPTQDALAILEIVRPAFEAFDRLRDINQAPAPQMTWLNFGTYESLAIDILPGLMHSLRKKMPHLRLGLRVSRTPALLTMVRKGELCSALVAETDDLGRFYSQEVARDRLGIFVSARHPIAGLGWKAVETHGLGSLAPSKAGLPRYFSRYLRRLDGIKPFVLSDSFETLRAAACAGSLAAVLPYRIANRTSDLIEVQPPKTKGERESGEHRILVVSLASCDRAETDFLADEARRLMN